MLLDKPFRGVSTQQSPYLLNGAHPLTKGLVFAFSGHHGMDLVSGTRPTNTNVSEIGYFNKHAWSFAGGAVGNSQLDFGALTRTNSLHFNPATWAFYYTINSSNFGGMGSQNDGGAAQGWQVFTSGGKIALNCTRPGTDLGYISNLTVTANILHALVITYDGSELQTGVKIWQDGVLGTPAGGGTDGAGGGAATTTSHLFLGRQNWGNPLSHNGPILVSLMANRTWSDAEVSQFTNNPYIVFLQDKRLVYSFASLASGAIAGTTTIVFGSTAAINGANLATSTPITISTGTSTITGLGSLLGESDVVFSDNATGRASSSGSGAITFTGSGTLTAPGAMAATSAISFSGSAAPVSYITNTISAINLLQIVPAHTVALYQFQNNKDDSSGNVLNLSVEVGTEQYTDFVAGSGIRAFDFDGSTSLIAPNVADFRLTGDITVQFLAVRADNLDEWFFTCESTAHPGSFGKIYGGAMATGRIAWPAHTTVFGLGFNTSTAGVPHLYTFVRKGNIVRFFIDDNQVGESVFTGADTPFGDERFRVGAALGGGPANRDKVASMRVLDVARTDEQILQDFRDTLANTAEILAPAYGTTTGSGALVGTTQMTFFATTTVLVYDSGQADIIFTGSATLKGLHRILGTSDITFAATGTGYFPSVTQVHVGGTGLISGTGVLASNLAEINFEAGTSVLINIAMHAQVSITFNAELFPHQAFAFTRIPPFIHFGAHATGKIKVNNDIIRARVVFLTNEHRVNLLNTNKKTASKV